MDWNSHVLFEINDLYNYEPEMLEELEHIDRRSAVRQILGSRIRRQFSDLDSENILDSITNPDVLTEPAILLNLHLVFFASSSGSDIYEQKARAYANRTEEAIARAFELLEFDGLKKAGVTLSR
ncbi:hypothetical protein DRQ36_06530 [bacterium]|nr:MAG: hypothetical protein DRQ36_06530 [bacterium]